MLQKGCSEGCLGQIWPIFSSLIVYEMHLILFIFFYAQTGNPVLFQGANTDEHPDNKTVHMYLKLNRELKIYQ